MSLVVYRNKRHGKGALKKMLTLRGAESTRRLHE